MRRSFRSAAIALVIVITTACGDTPTSTPELQALLDSDRAPKGIEAKIWADTRAFYGTREQKLAWLVADGTTTRTGEALATLQLASAHGLNPEDYGADELQKIAAAIDADEKADGRAQLIADLDVRLTARLLHLARDVAIGRLAPKSIDARWNVRRDAPDFVAALQAAAASDVKSLLEAVQPRHPEYAALRAKLETLRSVAAGGWPTVPRTRLKIGQRNNAVIALRQRLAAAGYLRERTALDSPQFDADVERGVKAFQMHHGLPATGVLDHTTIEQMNVPLQARISQLALNLERWRWLPDDLGARHFIVNVPQFHLFAREQGKTVLDMRVVVGKRGNETPLFSDQMETVVFSPYWNIPETIALEETLPAVQSDPEFLSRNNMEIVNTAGEVVPPEDVPWDDEAALNQYRFRQRPGDDNALGYVKFLFPNEHAVYLHDTPADALFKRIGRAFSHGCVRVEDPQRLAEYVLRDRAEWTPDAIETAMQAGDERHVKLSRKIPISIVYFTAWVDERGALHFAQDVYGYDAKQSRATSGSRSATVPRAG